MDVFTAIMISLLLSLNIILFLWIQSITRYLNRINYHNNVIKCSNCGQIIDGEIHCDDCSY